MSAKTISFIPEMAKAIFDGTKTQTRRAIKIKNKLTRDWAITTGKFRFITIIEDKKKGLGDK